MKEGSRGKVLKGKVSQNDPPYLSSWIDGPGGQQDQGHGVVLHDQGEEYQQPIIWSEVSSSIQRTILNC